MSRRIVKRDIIGWASTTGNYEELELPKGAVYAGAHVSKGTGYIQLAFEVDDQETEVEQFLVHLIDVWFYRQSEDIGDNWILLGSASTNLTRHHVIYLEPKGAD